VLLRNEMIGVRRHVEDMQQCIVLPDVESLLLSEVVVKGNKKGENRLTVRKNFRHIST
jgi:hypothetical protein